MNGAFMIMQNDSVRGAPARGGLTERLELARQLAERQQTLLAVAALAYRSKKLDAWPEVRRQRFEATLPGRLQQMLRTMDYVGEADAATTCIPIIATLQELGELEPIVRRLRSVLMDSETELDDLETSIGLAVYPFDSGVPDDLLLLASSTAIEGLGVSRHHCSYANEELEAWRAASGDLYESIIHGLGRGEFEVLYQPVIAADTGLPVAVEALLHWRHPERGVLTPGSFLPFAQRYTWLIRELDEWVLAEVAHALPAFDGPFPAPLKVSLNVGLPEILAGDFTTHLQRQLARLPELDARRLVFELPRDALRVEDKRVTGVIKACQALGVSWALDADFEHLSLNALAPLPLEWVKFDTRALQSLSDTAQQQAAFRALGQLTCALGSRPVFTHVEDDGLRQGLGGDAHMLLQGFAIAAPMQPSVLRNWLQSRR